MTKISPGSRGRRSRAVLIAKGVVLPRELYEAFKQSVANDQWLVDHFEEIQERFPNRWVAIYKGQVVDTACYKGLSALMKRLDLKKVPRLPTVVEFIYAKGERPTLILAVA